MNFAADLRRELADRARGYAQSKNLPHCLSYGEDPIVCFAPYNDDSMHGNFLPASYKAIHTNDDWKRRLTKVHTLGRHSFPRTDRGRWMELDTCTSSDALLMNIFCHPAVLRRGRLAAVLGVDAESSPCFGYRARVPLANGRSDRTEVDLRLGNQLIEAKLTESDFQSAEKSTLMAYRDFTEVFDWQQLPQTETRNRTQNKARYISYQLTRNVLAAYALRCSFRVLIDARRPDLIDAWYAVVSCVKPVELRVELRISTWQELAAELPLKLQAFLAAKYGVTPSEGQTSQSSRAGKPSATSELLPSAGSGGCGAQLDDADSQTTDSTCE